MIKMKKILTILLLLSFCTVQSSWAGETIIIGSDGQARYGDEAVEEHIGNNTYGNSTIINNAEKYETVYLDIKVKGNIKMKNKLKEIRSINNVIDNKKNAEFQDYIKNAPKQLTEINSILKQCGYYKKTVVSMTNKDCMKIDLLDGDYLIGFKGVPYYAEYHKDGTLMGLVKIEIKEFSKNKGSIIFYEYRAGYNTTSGMGLKHILFLDFVKDKYISQYIYEHDGTLICSQINNEIYVNDNYRNMLINTKVINSNYTNIKKDNKKLKKIFGNIAGTVLFPVLGPIAFVVLFIDLVFLTDNH